MAAGYADAIVSIAAVLVLVPASIILAYLLLSRATRGPEHVFKRLRFEAGNPPGGEARVPTLYQYLGYILIFIALDPVFMLLFVLPAAGGRGYQVAFLVLASVAAILPPIVYAVRYARRREYWGLP